MTQEKSTKKILLVTRPIAPPWDEASKNFAYYLAKNISDFEFNLLTNGLVSDLPENIRQRPIYTSNDFSYFQKLRLLKHLRKIRKEFDILHYLFTPTKQNSFLIKTFVNFGENNFSGKKARTIQTIATLREDLYSDAEIKKLLFGDLIITYSDYAKNKLNTLGFDNVKRVYPGIDLQLYSPAPKDPELMRRFGIESRDFVATFHGEYTRLGGTDKLVNMLIEKSEILKQKNIKILMACRLKNSADAKKRDETATLIHKNNLEKYIILTDESEKAFTSMEKIYNLADVATFPVENMKGKFDVPLVAIEAMACKKPLIISDLPIFQEFANEQNSVKIEAGNMESFFETILNVYENKSLYSEIGKNARKFVEENFDIRKIAEIYKEIYKIL